MFSYISLFFTFPFFLLLLLQLIFVSYDEYEIEVYLTLP